MWPFNKNKTKVEITKAEPKISCICQSILSDLDKYFNEWNIEISYTRHLSYGFDSVFAVFSHPEIKYRLHAVLNRSDKQKYVSILESNDNFTTYEKQLLWEKLNEINDYTENNRQKDKKLKELFPQCFVGGDNIQNK